MDDLLVLVGSFARGEEDENSDIDLVWIGDLPDPELARDLLARAGYVVDGRRVDFTWWTHAAYADERRAGSRRAWEIEISSVHIMGVSSDSDRLPLHNFPFESEIYRLGFLLKESNLFARESLAANLCDAGFLYGIIREFAITLDGARPQMPSFARAGILRDEIFQQTAGKAYPFFCAFVRSASVRKVEAIDKDLLHLVRESCAASLKRARETLCGGAIDMELSRDWKARASHHRKSVIVADVFSRAFPDTPPLVYGCKTYDWWFSHPDQRVGTSKAEAIAKAHQMVWQTLGHSTVVTDNKWENFVVDVVRRVAS